MKSRATFLFATALLATATLAATPASKIFVVTFWPPGLYTMDAATGMPLAFQSLPAQPVGLAGDPTRDIIYVGLANGMVFKMSSVTGAPVGIFYMPGLGGDIQVSADGTTMVALGYTEVLVIDLPAGTLRHRVPALAGLFGSGFMDITADAMSAYVSDTYRNQVQKIDLMGGTVAASIPVGHAPMGVAISADGATVHVGNYGELSLSVIDTGTDTEIARTAVAGFPFAVLAHSNGSCYVANGISGLIGEHDAATGTQLDLFSAGTDPFQMGEVNGEIAIIGSWYQSSIQMLDPTNGLSHTVFLPGIPLDLEAK